VPQGGNTGLVGGSTSMGPGETILSLARLNKVIQMDPAEGVIECEAGCILETLQDLAGEHGFEIPLDLGAKGSCMIGGNLSTNAGGVRFVRHGPLAAHLLKLHVVDGTGRSLEMGSLMRKDNTGYDLKQLFLGAEGTLGVITSVALSLPRAPKARQVALLRTDSFAAAAALASRAKAEVGEALSAVEWIDDSAAAHVYNSDVTNGSTAPLADMVQPEVDSSGACRGYLLVEAAGSDPSHDYAKLEAFLTRALTSEDDLDGGGGEGGPLASDGVVAMSAKQCDDLWALREGVAVSLSGQHQVYKYDLSLPVHLFPELITATSLRLTQSGIPPPPPNGSRRNLGPLPFGCAEVVCWGHLGDGNIHLNVATREADGRVPAALEPWLFHWVNEQGGSISAEHGIGRCKQEHLVACKSAAVLDAMAELKGLFDPAGILNPGKYLPSSVEEESEI